MPADTSTKNLVMKFGGTSVGSPRALQQVISITAAAEKEWDNLTLIVSAFSGVTDILISSAIKAAEGNLSDLNKAQHIIRKRHDEVINTFIPDPRRNLEIKESIYSLVDHFTHLCQAIHVLGEVTPRVMDTIAGFGERMSARVVAAILRENRMAAKWVEATDLIVTDNRFQAAVPDMPATREKIINILKPLLTDKTIPVVTGFIAATPEGTPTTLGRGGSDYTAAILGVCLAALEVWIWTDVDGVMTADPRLAPDARTIPEISYKEVAELAYYGAKVLHPKTIRPVIDAGITLRVRNTFNPAHHGTLLVETDHDQTSPSVIKAVTAFRGINLITLEGRGMLGVPGVAGRIFSAVAQTGATVPLITEASSEQSITFAVPMTHTSSVIAILKKTFLSELQNQTIDRIWSGPEVVIVTAVCPRMRQRFGVAGKIFSALAENEVNVLAIAHGSSEVSISMVVQVDDLPKTVLALHQLTLPNGDQATGDKP